MTPEKLSVRIAERVKLETAAKVLDAEVICDGVEDDAIRLAVVTKHFGDEAVEGASAAHVAGMFAALTASKPDNGMRKVLGDSIKTVATSQSGVWGDNIAQAAGVAFKKGA